MEPHLRQHLRRQLIRRISKSGCSLNLKDVTPAEERELEKMVEDDLIECESQPTGMICRLKKPERPDN